MFKRVPKSSLVLFILINDGPRYKTIVSRKKSNNYPGSSGPYYTNKWENVIPIKKKNLGSLRHPETGLWSHEPGTSFPFEKSVQELSRVVDWFNN